MLDLIIASALEGLPEVISPNIPSLYKNNLDDRPSGLWDQLQALCRCGFRDVDCFYKYSIFAVFGGTK